MEKLKKHINLSKVFLLGLITLAFFLRTLKLSDNLFFGWEQGRDFLAANDIIHGDFALIGPTTSIPGYFHGVIYYYILALLTLVASGNPYVVALILVVINSISILFYYKALENIFGKISGVISSLLLTVSYISIIYSRWLSNPNLVPAFAGLLLYALSKLKDNRYYLLLVTFSWAIIFHLQSIVALSILPVVIVALCLQKIKYSAKLVLTNIALLITLFSSYLLFEVRNNYIMARSLLVYINQGSGGGDRNKIIDIVISEFEKFTFYNNIWLTVALVALCIIAVIFYRKEKWFTLFFAFTISSPLFFWIFKVDPNQHYLQLTHLFFFAVIGALYSTTKGWGKVVTTFVILMLFISNTKTTINKIYLHNENFLHYAQYTYLKNDLKIVDYIFSDSAGNDFKYNYFTVPYWKSEAWEYLFTWKGQTEYGYLPSVNDTKIFYVIIEPDDSQPQLSLNWYKDLNRNSNLVDYKVFGRLTVEKRTTDKNTDNINIDNFYERLD
ncbi:glycosyltransferase family 39 protein [Candidatus Woesebacteria bacterium]|nr:MAG: glycosyltransferase family 39 protein [Candidatus Woesebacteria bacterium]